MLLFICTLFIFIVEINRNKDNAKRKFSLVVVNNNPFNNKLNVSQVEKAFLQLENESISLLPGKVVKVTKTICINKFKVINSCSDRLMRGKHK